MQRLNIHTNSHSNFNRSSEPLKVTTPPPSRKNSTSTTPNMNLNIQSNPAANSVVNMQRSPSYESQSRNKIVDLAPIVLQQQQQYNDANKLAFLNIFNQN